MPKLSQELIKKKVVAFYFFCHTLGAGHKLGLLKIDKDSNDQPSKLAEGRNHPYCFDFLCRNLYLSNFAFVVQYGSTERAEKGSCCP